MLHPVEVSMLTVELRESQREDVMCVLQGHSSNLSSVQFIVLFGSGHSLLSQLRCTAYVRSRHWHKISFVSGL